METTDKLSAIATQMHLEVAEEVGPTATGLAPCGIPRQSLTPAGYHALGITLAQMGGGQTLPMLKTMLTTACERNCAYCPFRAGRNYRRTTLRPEEMAHTFMQLADRGLARGIFLSSGIIKGGVTTQDKLIDTVDILRRRHQFRGYVHLKLMPGVEQAQVERAMQLADRVSVNLEAPTVEGLKSLAPMKQLVEELYRPLQWVEQLRRTQSPRLAWNGRWPSTVTQFVVGATGETDLALLKTTAYLQSRAGLRRAYFSAFRPVPDTPLAHLPAESPLRQLRLYQASFLLRDYGFDLEELPFMPDGQLPRAADPKLAWALAHLAEAPVELNRAGRRELLRVPGIGPKSAEVILKARQQGRLRDLIDLRHLGLDTQRLAGFVLLDGIRPNHQLRLF